MQRYILGRILQAIISLLLVSLVVFMLVRLTGDPLALLLDETATEEQVKALKSHLGLDKPLMIQYGLYIKQAVQGDFGRSIRGRRPVSEMVFERLPATLELGAAGMAVALAIGLLVGVYSAVKRGRLFDSIGKGIAILGQALPVFWLGILLILVFTVWLNVLPAGGRGGFLSYIMPAFALGWHVAAGILRLTRSSMIEVLDADYIKLARVKGVNERSVIWKHAFKNAFLPVLTFSVIIFVTILGSAVVTETVFAWPGMGRLMIDSVKWRDFSVVQAIVLLFSAMYIAANLLVDILYAYLNPKIRYVK